MSTDSTPVEPTPTPVDPTSTPVEPVETPLLTITGNATDEEIAAVTAVVSALARPADRSEPAATANGWAAHWRRMGAAPAPGPDTWRMSARP